VNPCYKNLGGVKIRAGSLARGLLVFLGLEGSLVIGKINVQTAIQVGGNQVVNAQAISNYLARCPWYEVVGFMVVLSQLQPVQNTSTEPTS
jgi:hypothetical protein